MDETADPTTEFGHELLFRDLNVDSDSAFNISRGHLLRP
jgi:hypothetical protein